MALLTGQSWKFFGVLVRIQLDIYKQLCIMMWLWFSGAGRAWWGERESIPALPFSSSCSLTRRDPQSKLQRGGLILVRHQRNNHSEVFLVFGFQPLSTVAVLWFSPKIYGLFLPGWQQIKSQCDPCCRHWRAILPLLVLCSASSTGGICFSLVDLNTNTLGSGSFQRLLLWYVEQAGDTGFWSGKKQTENKPSKE